MAGRLWRRRQSGSSDAALVKQVASLRAELRLWQATLDHQIASIDRRLRGVEEAAAAAATEAQIVSRQMSDQIHHQSEGVPLHPAAADH